MAKEEDTKQYTRKRNWPWQEHYRRSFGLRAVMTGDGSVESAVCRFCEVFGREDHRAEADGPIASTDSSGVKRRRKTANSKRFEAFRPDNIRQHMVNQHKDKWALYSGLLRAARVDGGVAGSRIDGFFDEDRDVEAELTAAGLAASLAEAAAVAAPAPVPITVVRRLMFVAPQQVEVQEDHEFLERMGRPLSSGEAVVRATCSGVSAGTEMLVYRGTVPEEMRLDEKFDHAQRKFGYPTEYGYAMVGRVQRCSSSRRGLEGQRVFCFAPHREYVITHCDNLHTIPSHISDQDAVFFPQIETALSLVMDAGPLNAGDHVIVIGLGVVGLLTAAVLRAAHPLVELWVADPRPSRRHRACSFLRLSEDRVLPTATRPPLAIATEYSGFDVAIEVSGSSTGLNSAIECTGSHGKVVVGSWFGTDTVMLDALGGAFHRSHMTVVASQVSEIPAAYRGRWTKRRRFGAAWRLVGQVAPSQLITHRVALAEAPRVYAEIDRGVEDLGQVVFDYV